MGEEMETEVMSSLTRVGNVLCGASIFIRRCIFRVLRVGPIPHHIAFIMDGNQRWDKKQKPSHAGIAHDASCWALLVMMLYCYELGVKYVTAYAFSIDNFKRKPEEVLALMDSMLRNFDLVKMVVELFAVRVHFAGNLGLLSDKLRVLAMELMEVTAGYSNSVLTICVAYTSRYKIVHAIEECCELKRLREMNDNEVGP